jgi:actin-like ATPase involved in cell morphogenesis
MTGGGTTSYSLSLTIGTHSSRSMRIGKDHIDGTRVSLIIRNKFLPDRIKRKLVR